MISVCDPFFSSLSFYSILELTIVAVTDELSKLPSLSTDERLVAAGTYVVISTYSVQILKKL